MGDIAQGQQVSKKLPAKQLIPYVLLVVGAVAMAVSFFLPFASAKGDYAEYLKQYGDRVYTAEAGLHNKDVVGLSLLTFLLIQISSFRYLGVRGKLKHMCDPYIFMFPLNILEDCTLPVSLALRLFGNIFGGMIVVELWMYLMEWLSAFVSSVPFMRAVFVLPLNAFFDIFEPVIQTYIFVTLTMVFLSKGIMTGADENHA